MIFITQAIAELCSTIISVAWATYSRAYRRMSCAGMLHEESPGNVNQETFGANQFASDLANSKRIKITKSLREIT